MDSELFYLSYIARTEWPSEDALRAEHPRWDELCNCAFFSCLPLYAVLFMLFCKLTRQSSCILKLGTASRWNRFAAAYDDFWAVDQHAADVHLDLSILASVPWPIIYVQFLCLRNLSSDATPSDLTHPEYGFSCFLYGYAQYMVPRYRSPRMVPRRTNLVIVSFVRLNSSTVYILLFGLSFAASFITIF